MRKHRGKQEEQFEHRLQHILDAKDYATFNCARSKPVDIIAVKHKTGQVYLIEAKGKDGRLDSDQLDFQMKLAKLCNVNYVCLKQAREKGKIRLVKIVSDENHSVIIRDLEDLIIE